MLVVESVMEAGLGKMDGRRGEALVPDIILGN
jgi:hypothetical protein